MFDSRDGDDVRGFDDPEHRSDAGRWLQDAVFRDAASRR
jgi:hypothetical protein